MEYKEIFPTILGIKKLKHIPDFYIDQCIEYIKTQPVSEHLNIDYKSDKLTINQQILDTPHFLPLKEEIIKYALTYSKKLKVPLQNLQISNSWGYIIKNNNKQNNFHLHHNSLLSGVMYLTSGSPLIFRSTFLTDLQFKTFPTTKEQSNLYHSVVPIEKKQLVLFPSHLEHCVENHTSDKERVSIAFNIIPKGIYGLNYSLINFK